MVGSVTKLKLLDTVTVWAKKFVGSVMRLINAGPRSKPGRYVYEYEKVVLRSCGGGGGGGVGGSGGGGAV